MDEQTREILQKFRDKDWGWIGHNVGRGQTIIDFFLETIANLDRDLDTMTKAYLEIKGLHKEYE